MGEHGFLLRREAPFFLRCLPDIKTYALPLVILYVYIISTRMNSARIGKIKVKNLYLLIKKGV